MTNGQGRDEVRVPCTAQLEWGNRPKATGLEGCSPAKTDALALPDARFVWFPQRRGGRALGSYSDSGMAQQVFGIAQNGRDLYTCLTPPKKCARFAPTSELTPCSLISTASLICLKRSQTNSPASTICAQSA